MTTNPHVGHLHYIVKKKLSPWLRVSKQQLISKLSNKPPHHVTNTFKKLLRMLRQMNIDEPNKPLIVRVKDQIIELPPKQDFSPHLKLKLQNLFNN